MTEEEKRQVEELGAEVDAHRKRVSEATQARLAAVQEATANEGAAMAESLRRLSPEAMGFVFRYDSGLAPCGDNYTLAVRDEAERRLREGK